MKKGLWNHWVPKPFFVCRFIQAARVRGDTADRARSRRSRIPVSPAGWRGWARRGRPPPILEPFEKEHIGGIRIRTTEACSAGRLAWKRAAVAQDIGVQKRSMHGQRAMHPRSASKSKLSPGWWPPLRSRRCGYGDAPRCHTSPKKRRISASALSGASEPWITL